MVLGGGRYTRHHPLKEDGGMKSDSKGKKGGAWPRGSLALRIERGTSCAHEEGINGGIAVTREIGLRDRPSRKGKGP